MRVVAGQRLRLWTDLPPNPAIDELPAAFAAAVSLWAEHFGVAPERVGAWHAQAFLIDDRGTFAALGLMPERNPEFANGFAQGRELWLVEQPSDYYRRHLLLHEGGHAFMYEFLGGTGPGWYAEGMAELLGSHTWNAAASADKDRLRLPAFPAKRDDVPMWGRVRTLRDAAAAGASLSLEAVLALDGARAISDDAYAWTWALCALLDGHPQFRARFRTLAAAASEPEFNDRVRQTFAADWGDLACEWQAYCATIDYGYDFARMAMTHREANEVGAGEREVRIRADRGWQSTGAVLRAGRTYQISAQGRYVIAVEDGRPWPCEPGGVTLRWHAGRPLGELHAALRPMTPTAAERVASPPDRPDAAPDPDFAAPCPVGLAARITPRRDAILYLRVNDSAASLSDNSGDLRAVIAD